MANTQGRNRVFTNQELRTDLDSGLKPFEVAEKYGVSRAAVSKRITKMEGSTAAAVVAPQESRRFVSTQIDAMEQLSHSLGKVGLLMEACDEWLRDADDPNKYDIGPRSDEIMVTYYEMHTDGQRKKAKKPLSELLQIVEKVFEVDGVESKHADPRELILKTAQETRATVSTAADLAEKVLNARSMLAFREALMTELSQEDPDFAQRVAERLRRSILLHNAVAGVGREVPV